MKIPPIGLSVPEWFAKAGDTVTYGPLSLPVHNQKPYGACIPCEVVRAVDGDTIEIRVTKEATYHVRLIDCKAKESGTPKGDLATVYASDMIEEADATYVWHPAPKDMKNIFADLFSFERALGHIFLIKAETLSERMVRTGHATRPKK